MLSLISKLFKSPKQDTGLDAEAYAEAMTRLRAASTPPQTAIEARLIPEGPMWHGIYRTPTRTGTHTVRLPGCKTVFKASWNGKAWCDLEGQRLTVDDLRWFG